jgi:hypothetical protein
MNSNRQSNPPFHSLELSEAAQNRVLEHVHNFARVLIGQAKANAYYENLDTVSETHVDEALDVIKSNYRRSRKPIWTFIGGTVTGSAIVAFITAIAGSHILLGIIFGLLSIGGAALSAYGLAMRRL